MMSKQKLGNDVLPNWFSTDEDIVKQDELSGEMPTWAALPELDTEQESQKEAGIEDRVEIPGFPTSITPTWAYFPEFF